MFNDAINIVVIVIDAIVVDLAEHVKSFNNILIFMDDLRLYYYTYMFSDLTPLHSMDRMPWQ